ncbi:hypothetical protein B551_0216610 [Cupriavidus sp. HPC(L)]|nr:hypothetical protein B551_0216610 [Cupriavidus sp. HPC(L)]
MLQFQGCQALPLLQGLVETGRHIDGGINGAWDEYLGGD